MQRIPNQRSVDAGGEAGGSGLAEQWQGGPASQLRLNFELAALFAAGWKLRKRESCCAIITQMLCGVSCNYKERKRGRMSSLRTQTTLFWLSLIEIKICET